MNGEGIPAPIWRLVQRSRLVLSYADAEVLRNLSVEQRYAAIGMDCQGRTPVAIVKYLLGCGRVQGDEPTKLHRLVSQQVTNQGRHAQLSLAERQSSLLRRSTFAASPSAAAAQQSIAQSSVGVRSSTPRLPAKAAPPRLLLRTRSVSPPPVVRKGNAARGRAAARATPRRVEDPPAQPRLHDDLPAAMPIASDYSRTSSCATTSGGGRGVSPRRSDRWIGDFLLRLQAISMSVAQWQLLSAEERDSHFGSWRMSTLQRRVALERFPPAA